MSEELEDVGQPVADTETQQESTEEVTESPKYEIDGQEYDLDTIKEWERDHRNKSEWQKAYNQRDMEIADMRRQLQKTGELEEYLNKNPHLYDKVKEVFDSHTQSYDHEGVDPELLRVKSEAQAALEEIRVEKESIKLENDIKALKENYKSYFDEDADLHMKVVKHAHDNNFPNVRAAFKDLMWDKYATDNRVQGDAARQDAARRSKQLGTPQGSGKAKPTSVKGLSDEAVFEKMMNDPRFSDLTIT